MASFKRSKRVRIPTLPLEIIFNILLLIPAEILYNVMRRVCQDWYNIIHDPRFVSLHLLRAPTGMVVEQHGHSDSVGYVDAMGSEIKLKKEEFPWKTKIIASCNGLWLLDATANLTKFPYYVANPVTKKLLGFHAPHQARISGLGYGASIGAYKVVSVEWNSLYYWKIQTLGVDKSWRCIGSNPNSYNRSCIFSLPLAIKGFMYWRDYSSNTIQALDMDTESFHSFSVPKGLIMRRSRFLPMGDYLAFLGFRDELRFEVWVAREVKRTGEEWTRLPDVNLGNHPYLYENRLTLWPAGWLREGELVFFKGIGNWKNCVICNIKTGEISTPKMDFHFLTFMLWPYIPSLVSI